MKSLRSGLVMTMTAGALVILPMSNTRVTRMISRVPAAQSVDPKTIYSPRQREYWLSTDEFGYIRPGLNITVNSITNVGPGLHPVVDVSMTDDLGQPVDRQGKVTPGAVEVEFILARYNPDTRDYFNYTSVAFGPGAPPTPLHDVGGTWTDIDLGHAKYTFAMSLPSTFDITQTATLGIYAGRRLQAIVGKDYNAPSVIQSFRPDGGAVGPAFDALETTACNSCHNPLKMHGQFEGAGVLDAKLCVMCHTPDFPITQTGQSLNFKVMVHKIHRGANLPSVQAGTPYTLGPDADFSSVVFPQDIRNCATCHAPSAAGASNWFTFPSRAACQACHDNVDFTTGANHDGGAQADDSQCASCHVISAPGQYDDIDAPIEAAHWVPYKSDQLHGLKMTILSVTNVGAGKKPVVTYQITDKNGASMDPRPFDTVQFTLGGPTTDYATLPISEDAQATTTWDGTTATYAFKTPIPESATGTWALTCDVELAVVITRPNELPPITDFTESPLNPVYYIAITDPQPVPRREVVDLANCNTCHDRLSAHGGRRLNTQGCIICHNPNNDDGSKRPPDQDPPESISFQRMIHRIHTGENLAEDFSIFGFGGSKRTFNDVRFPGDRRDCQKCHAPDTQQVPDDTVGRIPTITQRDWYTPMQPIAAACLGCHSENHQAAHAFTMTAPFGEACAACHGADAEFAVDKVHAR